ncbi:Protein transport protein Sec16A [Trichinella britovi]|uniref:Protein transport protein Sec16A n=1 Tax=Trichinella britovi TaxID=45882 RepID=A0A0V1DIU7_TRIBR|nr:Protein transport protein Sec16A [Trichinella britovi]
MIRDYQSKVSLGLTMQQMPFNKFQASAAVFTIMEKIVTYFTKENISTMYNCHFCKKFTKFLFFIYVSPFLTECFEDKRQQKSDNKSSYYMMSSADGDVLEAVEKAELEFDWSQILNESEAANSSEFCQFESPCQRPLVDPKSPRNPKCLSPLEVSASTTFSVQTSEPVEQVVKYFEHIESVSCDRRIHEAVANAAVAAAHQPCQTESPRISDAGHRESPKILDAGHGESPRISEASHRESPRILDAGHMESASVERAVSGSESGQSGNNVLRPSSISLLAPRLNKQSTASLHRRFREAAAKSSVGVRRSSGQQLDRSESAVISLLPTKVTEVVSPVTLLPCTAADSPTTTGSGSRRPGQAVAGEVHLGSDEDRQVKRRAYRQRTKVSAVEPKVQSRRIAEVRRRRYYRRHYSDDDDEEEDLEREYEDEEEEEEDDDDDDDYEEGNDGRGQQFYRTQRVDYRTFPKSSGRSSARRHQHTNTQKREEYYDDRGALVRSMSRMSDREDNRYTVERGRRLQKEYRPKSAQSQLYENRHYDDSDEEEYYYKAAPGDSDHPWRVQSHVDPRIKSLLQTPGWRQWLLEYYRLNGRWPTYDMIYWWSTKQRMALSGQTSHTVVGKAASSNTSALNSSSSTAVNQPVGEDTGIRGDLKKVNEPYLYSQAHAIARFGSGGNLIIHTSGKNSKALSTSIEIRSTWALLADSSGDSAVETTQIREFPGPLDSQCTLKETVLQYCQKQLELFKGGSKFRDHSSLVLFFQMMMLLIRQNGVVSGVDLAELLLGEWDPLAGDDEDDNDQHCDVEYKSNSSTNSTDSETENGFVIARRADAVKGRRVLEPRRRHHVGAQTANRAEKEFVRLLLRGSKKEALELAMGSQLWGHALFLAMKMGPRFHSTVMTRFANSVPLDSPLQTLYQMLSGGIPYASTRPMDSVNEWRAHLAMILANLTQDPADFESLQRQMYGVLSMGDSLVNNGQTFAGQFCFICCQLLVGWDAFEGNAERGPLITLIGADRDGRQSDETVFVTQKYLFTELVEYALALHWMNVKKATFWIRSLQKYKLQYALHLAELGFREEVLNYCKVLYKTMAYEFTTTGLMPDRAHASIVYALASRFQRFDVEHESYIQSIASDYVQPEWVTSLGNLFQNTSMSGSAVLNDCDHGGVEMKKMERIQSLESNLNAEANNKSTASVQLMDPALSAETSMQISFQRLQITQQQNLPNFSSDSAQVTAKDDCAQFKSSNFTPNIPAVVHHPHHTAADTVEAATAIPSFDEQQQQQQQQNANNFITSVNRFTSDISGSFPTQCEDNNVTNTFSLSSTMLDVKNNGMLVHQQQQQQQQFHHAKQHQYQHCQQQQQDSDKITDEAKRNQSWLGKTMGGIIQKFIPKGANEMILPDDSKKSIVWDEQKKRWVNMNASEDDASVDVAPPPKTLPVESLSSFNNYNAESDEQTFSSDVSKELFNLNSVAASEVRPNRFAVGSQRYVNVMVSGDSAQSGNLSSKLAFLPPMPTAIRDGGDLRTSSAVQNFWVPEPPSDSDNTELTTPFSDPFTQPERIDDSHQNHEKDGGVTFMNPMQYSGQQ